MTYLVTLNPDTDEAVSKEVRDDDIQGLVDRLRNGEAIQIRKADYLDTRVDDEIVFARPKLTLVRGGRA